MVLLIILFLLFILMLVLLFIGIFQLLSCKKIKNEKIPLYYDVIETDIHNTLTPAKYTVKLRKSITIEEFELKRKEVLNLNLP